MVVDTSVWIDFFAGRAADTLSHALRAGAVVLAPIVVAELVSGAREPSQRREIELLLHDLPVHETPVEHWLRVGELRLLLSQKGIAVSIPDAHIAQCALDLGESLLSRDRIFERIAPAAGLRLVTS